MNTTVCLLTTREQLSLHGRCLLREITHLRIPHLIYHLRGTFRAVRNRERCSTGNN
jgi:hypothetical protein